MEETRPIQCPHCRQRLSVPTTKASITIICSACKLSFLKPANESRTKLNHSSPTRLNYSSPTNKEFDREYTKRSERASSHLSKFTGISKNDSIKELLNVNPSPLLSSSQPRPQKRAVLCGISYNKKKYKLKGTINDVRNMRELLVKKFNFQEDGIVVLTEEEAEEHSPTKKNIERSLEWLVDNCRKDDSLVFYFSGHGLRQPDFNYDEIDGFDETICPLDFLKEGMILDNYINTTIVRPLTKGVTLHAIVDACHSGTILDLLHTYNRKEKKWENNTPPSGVRKSTSGGLAICISACEDNQVASDTSAFSGKTMNGAMTYILTEIIDKHPGISYGDLLDMMHERIDEFNKGGCLRRIFNARLSQKPQLTSSEKFNVYEKHLKL